MQGSVRLYTVTRVDITDLEGISEEDLISKALIKYYQTSRGGQTPSAADLKLEIARYEVLTVAPNLEQENTFSIYQDRDFLDAEHEDRLDGAQVFDFDFLSSL